MQLIEVRQCGTIEEGLLLPRQPFVVRSCLTEFPSKQTAWQALLSEKALDAYSGLNDDDITPISTKDAIEQWKSGTLVLNVLDHPAPLHFAPLPIRHNGVPEVSAFLLTGENHWTDFHRDGLVGPGEWMFLYEGQKQWYLADEAADLSAAFCRGGDFIYFPSTWRHAVKTIERAFGLTGYC